MIFFSTIHRAALCITLGCTSFLIASVAFADDPVIFDVRRSLPLESDEPVYHDFYISAGPESGMKKGAYITVVRQVPVHDPIANKQQATLNIKIGRLQVIHVERGITVARLETEFDDEDRPTVEFESVMIGDRVDLASISNEASEKKKKVKAHAKTAGSPKEAVETVAIIPVAAPVQAAPADGGHVPASVPSTPETGKTQPASSPSQAPVSQSQPPKSA